MVYRKLGYMSYVVFSTFLVFNFNGLRPDLNHICAHSNESVVKFRKTMVGLDRKEAVAICLADKISSKHSLDFDWPVDLCDFWVSSLFGPRTYKGVTKMHHGIDLASLKGTVVKAAADGKVDIASTDVVGYGSLIELKHAKGFTTRYGHLEEILVQPGDFVQKGDVVGTVGAKGNVRGKKDPSHLHFEIRRYGESLNPLKYLYCSEVLFVK
ncbi:M23 family metallopeptidase [Candidatus Dependentiae bacterium]|nr:M23 family metallopeptidase [Candidatus Dependentiae bacterium]